MAKKILILVRHGQYYKAEGKNLEKLTALGRKQAVLAGRRLRENKINRIVHSTMPRAVETAAIIKKGLRYRGKFESCEHLRECVPGFPKALRKKYGFTDVRKLSLNKKQADRAFAKYFRKSKRDSVEVLVCHGNIIRYLICKLLNIDTLKWREMDIQQCGITTIQIHGSKGILLGHNDVGHIPKSMRTFI